MSGPIQARGVQSREINRQIKERITAKENSLQVSGCQGQHNLGVGLLAEVSILFEGSVGYYCGGLMDGPKLEIRGNCGWGLGESMMSGTIQVRGNAGNSCAASLCGGTVVVHGSVAARAGVGMKGGLLIVGGDCGYMTGFMMQRGAIIVCGNAGPALADSMYEGLVYVAGDIQELGNDAVVEEPDAKEQQFIGESLAQWGIEVPASFKKVVAGRKLWNFDKQEMGVWKEAL